MPANRRAVLPSLAGAVRRHLPGQQPAAAGDEPAPVRPEPAACEYLDIGRGNGFLLARAGERPSQRVIGEIG